MPPEGVENQPPPAPECHYQCEVCNAAVFSTFKECEEHEKECAKKKKEAEDQEDDDDKEEKAAPQPSPNTQKKEEKEQRDAVEAVLRLKTGTEGSEA